MCMLFRIIKLNINDNLVFSGSCLAESVLVHKLFAIVNVAIRFEHAFTSIIENI